MIRLAEFSPATLDEAVDVLYDGLGEERALLRLQPGQSDGLQRAWMHHGPMMQVRNTWGLWHESVLAQHFKETYGLGHADDMSGLIQGSLLARIDGVEFDVAAEVERYKAHWRALGVDPLTQEKTA